MMEGDNLDLVTYDGCDPCLIPEPACQYCHAKESDTALFLCPTCSIVSYCSEECSLQDAECHNVLCAKVVRNKETLQTKALELRRKYDVDMDIHEFYRQGFVIPSCSASLCSLLQSFFHVNKDLAEALYELADQGETKKLWEETLEWQLKLVSLPRKYRSRIGIVPGRVPFILICLNRLDDAYDFIQKYLIYHDKDDETAVSDWYECRGDAGARFGDYVALARSIECSSLTNCDDLSMLMAVLLIAIRVRPTKAHESWKRTIDSVFLLTDLGSNLQPACSTLRNVFALR